MHDLRQLRHFYALAKYCNFARAAEAVNLSQPALTRSLQALERSLDCRLIDRSPRGGASLTEHGRLVLEHAERMLAGDRALKSAVSQLSNLESGELHVGAGPYPSAALVPNALGRLLKRYPRVNLSLMVDNWLRLRDQLLGNRIELYVADIREVLGDPLLDIEPLHSYPIVLFCNSRHPLLQYAEVDAGQLVGYPLAGTQLPLSRTLSLSRLTQRQPPLSFECDNFIALHRLVRESDALGLAPWDVVADEVKEGRLAFLSLAPGLLDETSAYGIVSRKGQSLSPAAAVLKDILREADKQAYAQLSR
jgi:DNA-binding transcriptional LysR family regulator